MIKGFLFDVDGVVINTENTHYLAFRNVFNQYNYKLTYDGYIKHFSGKSIRGGVLSLLTEVPLIGRDDPEQFIQAITDKKISQTLEHFKKQVVYFEDTISFIQTIAKGDLELKKIGYVVANPVLAMATGLESAFFTYVLRKHNLKSLFPIIVTADQYTHSKPDPECYLKALDKMKLKPKEVAGIEDSPSGIRALNAAGVYSIAVTNTNAVSDLREANLTTEALTELI